MANDYAAINFSAGQLQRLDNNDVNILLQNFEINYGENKVFENWLKMALIMNAIPGLNVMEFDSLNKKVFAGRRFGAVDEVKNATASALRVANHQSDDFTECADRGLDFAEVIERQAKANMLKEMYGINTAKTVESPAPAAPEDSAEESDAADAGEDKPKKKPAKKQVSRK